MWTKGKSCQGRWSGLIFTWGESEKGGAVKWRGGWGAARCETACARAQHEIDAWVTSSPESLDSEREIMSLVPRSGDL